MSLRVKVLNMIYKTMIYKTLHNSLLSSPSTYYSPLLFSIQATRSSLELLQYARCTPAFGPLKLLLPLLLSQIVVWFTHPPPTVTFSGSLSLDTFFKNINWPIFPSPYVSPLPYFIFLHSIYTLQHTVCIYSLSWSVCLLLYPQHLQQCLAQRRYSVNICWANE